MLGMYTGILPARTTPPVRICQYWGVSRRETVRNYKELGTGRGKGRIYNECFGPDEPRAGSRAIPLPPSLALLSRTCERERRARREAMQSARANPPSRARFARLRARWRARRRLGVAGDAGVAGVVDQDPCSNEAAPTLSPDACRDRTRQISPPQ